MALRLGGGGGLVVSFVALAALWPAPRLASLHERDSRRYPRWLEPLCGLVGVALFVILVYARIAGAQLGYSRALSNRGDRI
jgi:hypothetical protein